MQSTSKILMIRPINFGFNEQTSANNKFQTKGFEQNAAKKAIAEFDGFVSLLEEHGVQVIVIEDTPEPHTPDSIFPNNWFSTHQGGTLVLYPMFAPNRRLERKPVVLNFLREKSNVKREVDLTYFEKEDKFLEGTGSMVPDRDSNLIFACRSSRTNQEVLEKFCEELDYDYFLFDAFDKTGAPIYHTNVMMSVCTKFVLVCLDAIKDLEQRASLVGFAKESDKEIIEISLEQMAQFAGNILEVRNQTGEPLLVMSQTAKESLNREQLKKLESYCKIVSSNLSTIENNGGGSARCMIAELFIMFNGF